MLLGIGQQTSAQPRPSGGGGRCVVIDGETLLPVSHVSIYARENGCFHSVITDAHGRATVNFPFHRITVSHLNYEPLRLRRLADTIRLTPKYHLAAEVVVSSEPPWIRPLLRRFVKQKKLRYGCKPLTLAYRYDTRSIEGRSYYRYNSNGLLRMYREEQPPYAICQREGIITSVDSTRLTDLTNLRRMLYEDFVGEMDNGFIRTHRFAESDRENDLSDDEVELIFRSKRGGDDRGRFVIDTARLIVREARRTMGLKANRQARVSATMLALSRMMSGYNITAWDVDYAVSYAPTDSCWHPRDVRYKFFFRATENVREKEEARFDSLTGGGFSNMESTLTLFTQEYSKPPLVSQGREDSLTQSAHTHTLSPEDVEGDSLPVFKPLPRTWYIKINTDEERAYEIELSGMPARFVLLKEEE